VGGFVFKERWTERGNAMTPAHPSGRIETLNGNELYFEVHRTGEPLVLLHGFSGSSQDWAEVITE
jgi:pimeloyl-ACP methyl ester carboxylesterase